MFNFLKKGGVGERTKSIKKTEIESAVKAGVTYKVPKSPEEYQVGQPVKKTSRHPAVKGSKV